MDRKGVAVAGSLVVDSVKMIDVWPEQDALANVISVSEHAGGAPLNVLADLSRLGAPFPLYAVGCIGDDRQAEVVRGHCKAYGIESRWLRSVEAATASTDVMTVQSTGRRTFFHRRGANAEFGEDAIPLDEIPVRHIHLAYLLLLDRLDAADPEFGTVAGRVLARARQLGLTTSVDVVSESGSRYAQVVLKTMPHVDFCFMNELETERSTGIAIDGRPERAKEAAEVLFRHGLREAAILHWPEASFIALRKGETFFQPSLALPRDEMRSSVGAGDALAAGVLFGLHEGYSWSRSLTLGVCVAAASLRHEGASEGVGSVKECLELAREYGFLAGSA